MIKKGFFNYKYVEMLIVCLYIISSLFTVSFWFREHTILFFDDEWFPFNPLENVKWYEHIWRKYDCGGISAGASNFYYSLWYLLLTKLSIPLWLAQAITTFLLIFIAFYSMHILIKHLLLKISIKANIHMSMYRISIISFLSSLFYVFNPFNMAEVWINFPSKMPITYSFYPLFLYLLIRFTENKKPTDKVLIPIFFYLSLQGTPKIWIPVLLYTLAFVFIYVKAITRKKFISTIKKELKSLVPSFIIFSLISISFFYPLILSSQTEAPAYLKPRNIETYVHILDVRTKQTTLLNTLRIWGMHVVYGPPYHNDVYSKELVNLYEKSYLGKLLSPIPLIIVLFGFLFTKRNKTLECIYLLFLIVALVIISMISVMHIEIFKGVFLYFYKNIPPMIILNEPWEAIGYFYVFSITILISIAFLTLSSSLNNKVFVLFTFLLIVCLLPNSYLFVTGKFLPNGTVFNAKVRIPDYIMTLIEHINDAREHGVVMLFPIVSGKVSYDWQYPFYGRNILSYMISDKTIDSPTNKLTKLISSVQNENSIYKYKLFVIDRDTEKIIMGKNLFYGDTESNFKVANIKFFVKDGDRFRITFYGDPVGHVDYALFFPNGSSKAEYTFATKERIYSFIVDAPDNSILEPRAWKDSNVSKIIIERLNITIGKTLNLSNFYINALRLLGIKWIITDNVKWKPYMSPDKPNRHYVEQLITPFVEMIRFNNAKIFTLRDEYILPQIYIPEKIIVLDGEANWQLIHALSSFRPTERPLLLFKEQVHSPIINFTKLMSENANNKNIRIEILESTLTSYKVLINNHSDSENGLFIVLAQNYDKFWKAYVIKGDKKKQVPEKFHFIANGYANAWFINETGNFIVELYYEPQRYYEISLLVSLSTFIFVIAYVLYNYVKNKLK